MSAEKTATCKVSATNRERCTTGGISGVSDGTSHSHLQGIREAVPTVSPPEV